MQIVQNQKGIALVTALMFTLIMLGIIMAVLQVLLMETKTSSSHRKYRNSLEASYGGVELMTKELLPRVFSNQTSGISKIASFTPGPDLQYKLLNSNYGTLSRTTNPKEAYDMKFQLEGTTPGMNYNVYGKIVDTIPGNSDTTGIDYLDAGVGVAGAGSGISPKHNPTLLSIEVLGELASSSRERALLSVLYAY